MPEVRPPDLALAMLPRMPAKFQMAVLLLLIVGGVVLAPLLLDTYMVNILIRTFFVAIAAITVDIV